VDIPKSLIEANAVNWLRLENRSRGRIYRLPLTLAIVEPYVSPLRLA
jgi:hypothetical protein